jgi:hypothetical protein
MMTGHLYYRQPRQSGQVSYERSVRSMECRIKNKPIFHSAVRIPHFAFIKSIPSERYHER